MARTVRAEDGGTDLPFVALTAKGDDGKLFFFRLTEVPARLKWRLAQNIVIFFFLSSAIVVSAFLYSERALARRALADGRTAVVLVLMLITSLLIKDVFSWTHRQELFLLQDPRDLFIALGGVLSAIVIVISSYQRIIGFLKSMLEPEQRGRQSK